MHISLAAETLFHIGTFPITNTVVTALLSAIIIIIASFALRRSLVAGVAPRGAQNIAEFAIDGLMDFFTTIAGSRKTAERFFPICGTVFIFVLVSNWMGILPGFGSVGFYEHKNEAITVTEQTGESAASIPAENKGEEAAKGEFVPFFRSVNADLNMTLALALIAITLSHYFGVATLGAIHHAGKFFTFKDPMQFFIGILEFIGEFAKIISLSFRLFGNVFAGEVLLAIMTFLAPYVAPAPFYALEIFVGFIQALIFSVLTMMYLSAATHHH